MSMELKEEVISGLSNAEVFCSPRVTLQVVRPDLNGSAPDYT